MPKKESIPIESVSKEPAIDIALDTLRIGKQAFVFASTKRGAEAAAEKIASKIKTEECSELADEILHVLPKPTKQCQRLANCVKKCIAFHHAGLHHKQRELVEDNFRKGKIKIICCTPTLAYGVSLPAFRVIIKDLKRYGGEWGSQYIPVLDYLQYCGRAGRPEFGDKFGEAVSISGSENEKNAIYEKYILGESESIYSKLAVEPVLRTYLLSLISTEMVNSKQEIFDFFDKTFWALQYEDTSKLRKTITKMLNLLLLYDFVEVPGSEELTSAEKIKSQRIEATLIGKRVAELYIDPLTANNLINGLRKSYETKNTSPYAYLQLISNQLEMRPLLGVRSAEYDRIQESLLQKELLTEEPSMFEHEYAEFLSSIKTANFFEDWVGERDEEYLLESYNIRPGEIKVKLDNADWLLYASEELAKLLKLQPILKEITKLRLRVDSGVKEELLPLLRFRGVGRVRARRLFNAKIKDIGDVKSADFSLLAKLVGAKTAASLKEQVGQKIEQKEVKKESRQGQMSLEEY